MFRDIIDPSEAKTGINTPFMPGTMFCSAPVTEQPIQTGKQHFLTLPHLEFWVQGGAPVQKTHEAIREHPEPQG